MRVFRADSFYDSLAALSSDDQDRVKVAAFDFERSPDHPSFQLHRVHGAQDPNFWSARVNDDLRLILYRDGDDTVFSYAAHHDAAYRWAERTRYVVNPELGAIQAITTEHRIEEVVDVVRRKETRGPLLFEEHDDDYLMRLDVPEPWLPAVKAADEGAFSEDLFDELPEEARENLFALATGGPVRISKKLAGRKTDPFLHPDAQRRFHLVEQHATRAFARALDAPWETWTVFLHPSQRDAVEQHHAGPARVTGGAGTGKTVVALHRAVHLARSDTPGPVLLTTFSKTLAKRLVPMIDLLMDPEEPARDRLQVVHLHHYAAEAWKEHHETPLNIVTSESDLAPLAAMAIAKAGHPDLDLSEFVSEWTHVIDSEGISSRAEYLAAKRVGRRVPLPPAERERIWDAHEALLEFLTQHEMTTFARLCHDVATIHAGSDEPPFRHVVADEAQDFGPAELRLLRSLAPAADDDLFLVSDPAQRIYQGPTSLLSAGIDVRGRSSVLRVNYRTTEQIRGYAEQLLPDAFDEADGQETRDRIVSMVRGPEPDVVLRDRVSEEVEEATRWLKNRLKNGYRPEEIGIFARTNRLVRERANRIVRNCGLEPYELRNDDGPTERRVSVGTMHRAKGLEFKVVMVIGCEEGILPSPAALETGRKNGTADVALQRERNLFYVACTRPRDRLFVSAAGEATRFLRATS
jgi:hypothetical protein